MGAHLSQLDLWNGWHARTTACDPEPFHDSFRSQFIDETRTRCVSPYRILELGCGQGADSIYFANLGCQVDGLDFSPVAIRRAKELVASSGLDIRFHCLDMVQPLPFADGWFAGVFSYLSLHYFDDATTGRILKEVFRVLQPGGVLGFCVRSVEDPLFGVGSKIAHNMFRNNDHVRHFFSVDDVCAQLRDWTLLQADMSRVRYLDMRSPPGGIVAALATKPISSESESSDR